jgi:hypothetical protein
MAGLKENCCKVAAKQQLYQKCSKLLGIFSLKVLQVAVVNLE